MAKKKKSCKQVTSQRQIEDIIKLHKYAGLTLSFSDIPEKWKDAEEFIEKLKILPSFKQTAYIRALSKKLGVEQKKVNSKTEAKLYIAYLLQILGEPDNSEGIYSLDLVLDRYYGVEPRLKSEQIDILCDKLFNAEL